MHLNHLSGLRILKEQFGLLSGILYNIDDIFAIYRSKLNLKTQMGKIFLGTVNKDWSIGPSLILLNALTIYLYIHIHMYIQAQHMIYLIRFPSF